ncbi:MAG: Glycosyl transferase family protein [Microgenomates group bacterium Gr01-1014_16]|nr:MAG: Glycosyl transferase family protein [Microgenomates group bacterium Gr01-1014_16]
MKFIFWSMASHGSGLSGGDRIYIEFARRWSKDHPLIIVTWEEGIDMMRRNNLRPNSNISFLSILIPHASFFLQYITRIFIGLYHSLIFKIDSPNETYLYSASEFWMDSLPCFILKLRYPHLKWVATWYQTAPSPLTGFGPGRHRLSALWLWLSQLPIKPLITNFADCVLVNNDLEKKVFPQNKAIVVLGAVDTTRIDNWLAKNPKVSKKYAAVFQGRFHPQKGVVELIDIWKKVVEKIPRAKLAMIGDGPLMNKVKLQISNNKLQNNVKLFGFVFDGQEKYRIFAQSKIVVHPAFFDSGGMAAAEAMAFGIPAVGFNLPAFSTYYPEGMIKVSIGNLNAFADAIIDLLKNSQLRNRLGSKAKKFIRQSYSWDHRSSQILRQIVEKTNQEMGRVTLQ